MSQDRHLHKRKHYFIEKKFQSRFILKFCCIVLIGAAVSTGLLFYFSKDTLTSSFHQSRLVIKNTSVAILPIVIYTNLITLAFITSAVIFVTLFISHKLAGPMYRFGMELKAIGKGDLTKTIRLRKKDQLVSFADGINRMTASLKERILGVQADLNALIESAEAAGVSDELMDKMNRLDQKIKNSFKV